jgi:hypothetical protein
VRLDREPAIAQRLHDLGHVATPVVVPPSGDIAIEPSDERLAELIAATA